MFTQRTKILRSIYNLGLYQGNYTNESEVPLKEYTAAELMIEYERDQQLKQVCIVIYPLLTGKVLISLSKFLCSLSSQMN